MKTSEKANLPAFPVPPATLAAVPALAELSAEQPAKLAQNPVGWLIGAPLQSHIRLDFAPRQTHGRSDGCRRRQGSMARTAGLSRWRRRSVLGPTGS
ncbi:hypothetical protein [Accumulibacter sp.]|uniref:hypothetical protein n=1 Tax=Accumulibacter sp. TaxID=2053492 RepID=UPI00260CBC18|nr:hypothetical protein [Accumulibacter sp.]